MKWLNIKEKLPEINYENKQSFVRVLATDGVSVEIATYRDIFNHDEKGKPIKQGYVLSACCRDCGFAYLHKITHWMKIPELPN